MKTYLRQRRRIGDQFFTRNGFCLQQGALGLVCNHSEAPRDSGVWTPKKSTYGGKIIPDYEPRPPESEWVISIKEKLDQGHQDNVAGSWAKLCIYQIPRYLKNGEDKAWVPQIVSLGPYHHGDEPLCDMERHKWRCLHRVLERSNQGIGLYLDSVKKVEGRARACYEGTISMSREEFVEMMVLDGCFVIELFRGFAEGFEELGYPRNDPVFSTRESILKVQRDMIMLENQIPLFILDRLLGLQLGDPDRKGRVAKLAPQFFHPLMPNPLGKYSSRKLGFDPLYNHGRVHCLEVLRRSLLHLGPKRVGTKSWLTQSQQQLVPCVTELREAGVEFRRKFTYSFWDICFSRRDEILWIPRLVIHEGTRSLFLNLIAFEQCHFDCKNHITSYVILMHNLINSPEDVQYLRNRQIIEHSLGSDVEVVDLFSRLCQEVAFDTEASHFCGLSLDVKMYCGVERLSFRAALAHKWSSWRAILENKYFDSPWSIISVIAAFILLVLTVIQALYAVYGYYRRRS